MKAAVVDFDGVLNGLETREPPSPIHKGLFLNPVLVERLNVVLDRTGAAVVLSTSWRTRRHVVGAPDAHLSLDELREALRLAGFRGEVIDVTPDLARLGTIGREEPAVALWRCPPRSKEIAAWVESAKPDAFVVLDDDRDAGIDGHFIHVDKRRGLSAEDVDRAVEILGGPHSTRACSQVQAIGSRRGALTSAVEMARDSKAEAPHPESLRRQLRKALDLPHEDDAEAKRP